MLSIDLLSASARLLHHHSKYATIMGISRLQERGLAAAGSAVSTCIILSPRPFLSAQAFSMLDGCARL